MTPDPYKILGVQKNVTKLEIKQVFYKLSKLWHPDKNPNGTEKFKDILWAYQLLSNEDTKKQYDSGQCEEKKCEEFFSFEDIEEMFRGINNTSNMKQAPNIIHNIHLTLEEMYKGTRKDIKLTIRRVCPICHGLSQRSKNCKKCKGEKVIMLNITFKVKFKKGTLRGQEIVFTGEGDESPNLLPGNIVFKVMMEDNSPEWKLEGNDLILHKQIALGNCFGKYSIQIKPFWEKNCYYRALLPALTDKANLVPQYSRNFLIQNKGMPNQLINSQKGNLIVKFKVRFPSTSLGDNTLRKLRKVYNIKKKEKNNLAKLESLTNTILDNNYLHDQFKKNTLLYDDDIKFQKKKLDKRNKEYPRNIKIQKDRFGDRNKGTTFPCFKPKKTKYGKRNKDYSRERSASRHQDHSPRNQKFKDRKKKSKSFLSIF